MTCANTKTNKRISITNMFKNLKPGSKYRAFLAPMAGVTDVAFRALAKKYGAGMTSTEMISTAAIVKCAVGDAERYCGDAKTSCGKLSGKLSGKFSEKLSDLLRTDPSEKPVAVQLFGSNAAEAAAAAKIIEKEYNFYIIDFNCGCPADKIIGKDSGAGLLKRPEKISEIISAITSAVALPVTVKIRIGLNSKNINAAMVAEIVEKAGAAAITVHGRTAAQGYSGKADWQIIKRVKEAVNIPVIGNGDIFSPEQFAQKLDESGVDAIMIGRGAMGNPYLFKQILDYQKKGSYLSPDKAALFSEYLKIAGKYRILFPSIKLHAIWFTKGMRNAPRMRMMISGCNTIEEIIRVYQEHS